MPENPQPNTTQVTPKPPENNVQEPGKRHKNKTLLYISVFAVVLAILFGVLGYLFWSGNKKPAESGDLATENGTQANDDESTTTDKEIQDRAITPQADIVEWLEYFDPETEVSFMYPKGAVIGGGIRLDNPLCKGTTDCFEYTIEYDSLEIEIVGVTGIGGLLYTPQKKYVIVSGDQDNGMARWIAIESDGQTVRGSYFSHIEGPLVTISARNLSFRTSPDNLETMLSIADTIACSFYDVEMNQTIVYGHIYIEDQNTVVLVEEDGSEKAVFYAAIHGEGQRIDYSVVSPTYRYIAITTSVSGSGVNYLYVYDTKINGLLEINGEKSWRKIDLAPLWISNNEFVYVAEDASYTVFNAENKSQSTTTYEEFQEYTTR